MTAKDYLKQIEKLDTLIKNKLIEKQQWRDAALGITARMGDEKVQSSGNPQKMAAAIERYIDLEKEIDVIIDKLIDTKREIISVIEQLDSREYDLLHKIYVQQKELVEVADELKCGYSTVTTAHGRALINVQRIIDRKNVTNLYVM